VSDEGWFPPTGVLLGRSRSCDASPECPHAGSGIEPLWAFQSDQRFSFRLTRTEEKGHLSNVQAALSLARALVFGVASDAMAQQAMYEQMVFPTRFVWGYGGKQVRARPPTLAEFHASQIFSPPRVARPVRPRRAVSDDPDTRACPRRSRPRLTRLITRRTYRSTCAGRSPTGWRRCRWPPSPRPTGARCSRWCATCRRGTTSTSSSWTASGGTTRTRRSSRIPSVTSTTGASDGLTLNPTSRARPMHAPASSRKNPSSAKTQGKQQPRVPFFPQPTPPRRETDQPTLSSKSDAGCSSRNPGRARRPPARVSRSLRPGRAATTGAWTGSARA